MLIILRGRIEGILIGLFVSFFLFSNFASASSNLVQAKTTSNNFIINGKKVTQPTLFINNKVFVPLDFVNTLGSSQFIWNNKTKAYNYTAKSSSPINIIVAPKNGQYTSIQKAIDSIKDASPSKIYNIIIKPGVYKETIKTKHYVNLIGQSPSSCIIDYDSNDPSNYIKYSTIFATSNSSIENLTVKSMNAKYPLHSDYGHRNYPYKLLIRNCNFVNQGITTNPSFSGTAFGIGLYQNQHIEVYDSSFKGTSFGSAGIYIHNWRSNAGIGVRSLVVQNSKIEGVTYGLRIHSLENTGDQKNKIHLNQNKIYANFAEIFYEAAAVDTSWNISANDNTLNRVFQPNNNYIVEQSDFIKRVKNIGPTLYKGSVAITVNSSTVTSTTYENYNNVAGITLEEIPTGKEGYIQVRGWVDSLKVNGIKPIKPGTYLSTSNELGIASKGEDNFFARAQGSYSENNSLGSIPALLIPKY